MPVLNCYDVGKAGGFRGWLAALDAAARSSVTATLELLGRDSDWSKNGAVRHLRGKACAGITEIKVQVRKDKRELRVFGFAGPGPDDFTLLLGFAKIGGATTYGPYCNSAKWRRKGVEHDSKRAAPCSFP